MMTEQQRHVVYTARRKIIGSVTHGDLNNFFLDADDQLKCLKDVQSGAPTNIKASHGGMEGIVTEGSVLLYKTNNNTVIRFVILIQETAMSLNSTVTHILVLIFPSGHRVQFKLHL